MNNVFAFLVCIILSGSARAQTYFPPVGPDVWDTLSPTSLGWCPDRVDSLYNFLQTHETRAFILLVDGKIVLEKYFAGFTQSDMGYWASAGKSLTAVAVGIAQQQGHLSITDSVSNYLGAGWTDCTAEEEGLITVRNQLTMTTGLDETVPDPYCTLPSCLEFAANAGTRWAYHNAPYTLLTDVLDSATGMSMNAFVTTYIKNPTGMDGFFLDLDWNHVFFSTARSMARFGLLTLNQGVWDGTPVLDDATYFHDMTHPSQELNPAYGFLWWLNGPGGYMLPQSQILFPGSLMPNAPQDLQAALGKNGQFINVLPSQNMVWIRMGDAPDDLPVPYLLNDQIQGYINALPCEPLSALPKVTAEPLRVYPNPVGRELRVYPINSGFKSNYRLYNSGGEQVAAGNFNNPINVSELSRGVYFINLFGKTFNTTLPFVKE